MKTKKLEKLLKEISEEMLKIVEQGYEINIKLPDHFSKDCQLRICKPVILVESNTNAANVSTV